MKGSTTLSAAAVAAAASNALPPLASSLAPACAARGWAAATTPCSDEMVGCLPCMCSLHAKGWTGVAEVEERGGSHAARCRAGGVASYTVQLQYERKAADRRARHA